VANLKNIGTYCIDSVIWHFHGLQLKCFFKLLILSITTYYKHQFFDVNLVTKIKKKIIYFMLTIILL